MKLEEHLEFKEEEPELIGIANDCLIQARKTMSGLTIISFADSEGKCCDPGDIQEHVDIGNGFTLQNKPSEKPKKKARVKEAYYGVMQRDLACIGLSLGFVIGYGITPEDRLSRLNISYSIGSIFFRFLDFKCRDPVSSLKIERKYHKNELETRCSAKVFEYYPVGIDNCMPSINPIGFASNGSSRKKPSAPDFSGRLDYAATLSNLIEIAVSPRISRFHDIDEKTLDTVCKLEYLQRA